ncbi:metalloregulator ArsR/SmtB family transcription factor [Moritella sp. F3]|uniref:metalloregulator ArsR/SmtB family transcription factor n=1 Tax=Moritella sp. F3 TaxID=2718882 RepID=UPI0018E1D2DB|nr:metalloregulator ArsR/SmtB family transcription factor [Moritella sp. F3]GIC78837.1 transcriptional regulator [Moritella sp. F1]GIC81928.1 transcriptional regulator [Moritella sp. F3]
MEPTQLFKILSDETRLRILMLIDIEKELCVCELISALTASQPSISRNLAQLRKSGLLVGRKYKQWVFYAINPALPAWQKTILDLSSQQNNSLVSADIQRLNDMGKRPERTQQLCG